MLRFTFLGLICLLSFSCTDKNQFWVNYEQNFQIIPKPDSLFFYNGRFMIDSNTKITGDEVLEEEGDYLANILRSATGEDIKFRSGNNSDKGTIFLRLNDSIENEEGYILQVNYDKIIIAGKSARGVFYGIQTLRQLMPATIEKRNSKVSNLFIPAVKITDSPRYSYRGMHLDVSRHFFPTEFIIKYIDLIALHKMNTFHWHLTDDQGWRIEIQKYPRLTQIGGFRNGTAIGLAGTKNAPYTYDNIEYGGYYTQDEIRDIVDYAKKMHVTIIPEIELPGHSLSALAAYPEFGNTKGPFEVAKRWGIFSEIYAPTEATFGFLEDVLTEVIDLFPGKYIHIGGDEVLKKEWKESAYAQKLIQKNKLKDENGLQSYFIGRIEKFLNSKGKDIIGWDEILEGGLAPNTTVMSWRGIEGGIAAASQQHPVIMTPGEYCYFDYYQIGGEAQKKEKLTGSKRVLTVEKVYSFEPTPTELNREESKYILGAQGNVWTEYMKTEKQVEYMILPRMTALSEVLWSSKELRNWQDFNKRLNHFSKRYNALGVNYAKHSIVIDEK